MPDYVSESLRAAVVARAARIGYRWINWKGLKARQTIAQGKRRNASATLGSQFDTDQAL